jgi:HEAT repeat protein
MIAAALYQLGESKLRPTLSRALGEPTMKLVAAAAMAASQDHAGESVLKDILATIPAGRAQWHRAARALLNLGDRDVRQKLQIEIEQASADHSVPAAEQLARAGDAQARERLARDVADETFPRRGDAAVALARLGDARALGWVHDGLDSARPEDRKLALAICGLLPAGATRHAGMVAWLANHDPDLGVRTVAEVVVIGW